MYCVCRNKVNGQMVSFILAKASFYSQIVLWQVFTLNPDYTLLQSAAEMTNFASVKTQKCVCISGSQCPEVSGCFERA